MPDVILLDAGPLGMASHPRPAADFVAWLGAIVAGGVEVLVPEIADYEVRRELVRANRAKGIKRLDDLKSALGYLPITTAAMLQAAQFWADARRTGRPTARDESLDADVILAAQAATLGGRAVVVVATTNANHFSRFVPADRWQDIASLRPIENGAKIVISLQRAARLTAPFFAKRRPSRLAA